MSYTYRMWSFKKAGGTTRAIADVCGKSIGGALAWYPINGERVLCASVRVPLVERDDETSEAALTRTVKEMAKKLITAGAPLLRDAAGRGSIDEVLVAFASPWQTSSVRTQSIRPNAPFTYSRAMERNVLTNNAETSEHRRIRETVVATLLNGYLTVVPYGKRANNAELVVHVVEDDSAVTDAVCTAFSQAFHTRRIRDFSFTAAAMGTLERMHAHQKEFLLLSLSEKAIELASFKRGQLVDAGTINLGTDALLSNARAALTDHDNEPPEPYTVQPGYITPHTTRSGEPAGKGATAWLAELAKELKLYAARHALPRTVFLVAPDETLTFLANTLESDTLRSLWLSEEPVTMVPLSPRHLKSCVRFAGTAEGDVRLGLIACAAEAGLAA